MVEVRFACIPSVEGVKCTFDGVVKYTEAGLCSFFDIAQGEHTFSVEPPSGMRFVSGEDVFGRPFDKSGTTIIEWLPVPGVPWPDDQPWMMIFNFIEISYNISLIVLPLIVGIGMTALLMSLSPVRARPILE